MATGPEDPTRLTKPRVKFEDLESKERRIRIAYLENQQAELGTEIKLLKQRGLYWYKTVLLIQNCTFCRIVFWVQKQNCIIDAKLYLGTKIVFGYINVFEYIIVFWIQNCILDTKLYFGYKIVFYTKLYF